MKINLPTVEKGIPVPPYKGYDGRNLPHSVWPEFLKSLEIGDSFVVPYPRAASLMSLARLLNIELVKLQVRERASNGMAQARFWRVPKAEKATT